MKKLLILIVLVFLQGALALGFEEALGAAPGRPDAVSAQLRLINAESTQLRTEADPLALRTDRLQATQAVELARAELEQARLTAVADIAEAYGAVLLAVKQLELAERGQELAEAGLNIARIRVDNGSATALDLRDAEVAADQANAGAGTAASGLRLAVSNLEGMVAQEVTASELEPVPDAIFPQLPELEAVLAAMTGHPQLLQVQHGLELATAGVEMLDPSYASAAQIENARTQLATTEQLASEASRGLQLQARNLHLVAQDALTRLAVEQESHANASERFEFERQRLEGGLISEIALEQAAMELLQAELSLLSARNDALGALLRLSAGSLVPPQGPAVLRGER